jgi:hypothetical protein
VQRHGIGRQLQRTASGSTPHDRHTPANLIVALAACRPATVERAQISSRRLKSSGTSLRLTRPAAHPAAVSPSTGLLARLDSIHTPHPRHSNPHSSRRATHAPPPAVSSLGGLRTPAPCARHHRPGAGIRNLHIIGSDLFDHLFESDRRAYKIPTSSCPAAASSA